MEIKRVSGTELFHRYPRETSPQPCYVELDTRGEGKLSASYDAIIGSGVPMAVWNGVVLRWKIPALKAEAANALLDEIAPLAERIVDGAEVVWDGNNHVGRLTTEDARIAYDAIERLCEMSGGEGAEVSVWEASDYFEPCGHGHGDARLASIAREVGITARTSDARLAEIVDAEERKATENGIDMIRGVDDYLSECRAACRRIARENAAAKASALAA